MSTPRRRRSPLIGVLVAIAVALVVLGLAWWGITSLVSSPPPAPGAPVTVVIPPGASAAQIARILDDAGVVGSAGDFTDRVKGDGEGTAFRPGTYTFRTNEDYRRIVDQRNAGPSDAAETRLTIPEGYAIWEIEAAAAKAGIPVDDYRAALAAHEPPTGFLAPGEEAASLEGFLFPATYDLVSPPNADQLVADQLAAFSAAR